MATMEELLARRAELMAAAGRGTRAGEEREKYRQETNWAQSGIQGAAAGTAIAPGWGTLIGGVIGSGIGQIRAAIARGKAGQPWWKAIGNTIMDFEPQFRPETFQTALGVAPGMAGAFRGKAAADAARVQGAAPSQAAPQYGPEGGGKVYDAGTPEAAAAMQQAMGPEEWSALQEKMLREGISGPRSDKAYYTNVPGTGMG